MFCKKCGKEIESANSFCPNCGAWCSAEPAAAQAPAQKKKGKGCIIAVVIAALLGVLAVAVIVVAVIAFLIFGNAASKETEPVETREIVVGEDTYDVQEEEIGETDEYTEEVTVYPRREEFTEKAKDIEVRYDEAAQNAMTQYEMNSVSAEYYSEWDNLLNEVYQYLKSTMPTSEFENLQADELEWIDRKEAAMKAAAAEYEGGSMAPLAANTTGIDYTSERCYYLISLVEQ